MFVIEFSKRSKKFLRNLDKDIICRIKDKEKIILVTKIDKRGKIYD